MAEEANKLFKQEFGDKIVSLQQEVDRLQKQRNGLEQELKKERGRRGSQHSDTLLGETPPNRHTWQHVEDMRKELEVAKKENDTLRNVLEEKTSLSSNLSLSHDDEQNQSFDEEPELFTCTKCKQSDTLSSFKQECKNCREVFCNNCVLNEIPLPSSITPERVCDACYSQLLQQYASTPS